MRVGRGGASSRPPQVRGDCRGLRLGSESSGLVAEQTLVVANLRWRAVVSSRR